MIGYVIDLLYLCFVIFYANSDVEHAVKFLIVVCFFQNFILCIFSPYMWQNTFSIFILLKEIYVLLYIIFCIIKRRYKINLFQLYCCVVILIFITMTFITGSGMLKTRLSCLRQLYLPFIFYLFGSVSKISIDKIKNILKFYTLVSVVAAIFGFIEIALGNKLWDKLNIVSYCANKGIVSTTAFYNGLPGNFYSFDLPFLPNKQRMASFFVDPVICGQVLSLAFVIVVFGRDIFDNRIQRYIFGIILGIGVCLTLCKGGLIIAAFSFCILTRKVFGKKVLSNLMLVLGVIVVIVYIGFSLTKSLSTATHMNGLVSGFQALLKYPFGTGIGSAGNLSVEEGRTINIIGAESYIGSLMAQTGVVGLGINIYYFVYILKKSKKNLNNRNITIIIITLNLALGLTSLVNFTAISFTNCFMFIISIAMLHSLIIEKDGR